MLGFEVGFISTSEKYKGKITLSALKEKSFGKILINRENARTIKVKVQQTMEELLYEERNSER